MEETATQAMQSAEELAFEFSAGLFGFPTLKRFLVTEIPGGGDIFKQMHALDQPEVAFTLVFPYAFFADFYPDIPDEDVREIGAEGADQVIVMAIATIPSEMKEATANLKAPLIFNPYTRRARQVILADDRLSVRARLFKA